MSVNPKRVSDIGLLHRSGADHAFAHLILTCSFSNNCVLVAGARPVRGRRIRHADDAVQGRSAEGGLDAGHSRGAVQVVHESGDQEPARGVHHEPVVWGTKGQSGHLTGPLQQVRLIHASHAFPGTQTHDLAVRDARYYRTDIGR